MAYVGISCVAFSTWALALVVDRILCALFVHHFAYCTLAMALLGLGISAVLVSILWPQLDHPDKWAVTSMGCLAMGVVLCVRAASFMPVAFSREAGPAWMVIACAGLLMVPFFLSGGALSLMFLAHGKDVHRLCAAALLASALGAVAYALLLRPLGADGLIWTCCAVLALGLVMFGWAARFCRPLLLVVATVPALGCLHWGMDLVNDRPEGSKLSAVLRPGAGSATQIEHSEWTPPAKIDVLSNDRTSLALFMDLPVYAPHVKIITQDGDAHTEVPGGDLLAYYLQQGRGLEQCFAQGLGYLLRPRPDQSLILGSGGGMDVVLAKAFGARRITAVESNPAVWDLLQGRYRAFAQWPAWPEVEFVCEEGRTYVARAPGRFDTVVMSSPDTFPALRSGDNVLREDYRYTVEAVEDYLRALKPDGVMTVFRCLCRYPRENLRLANLFCLAARDLGVPHPSRCILVIAADYKWSRRRWASTLLRKTPFTQREVRNLLRECEKGEHLAAIYVPDVFDAREQERVERQAFALDAEYLQPSREAFHSLLRAPTESDRRSFEQGYEYNIAPVHDDRPFFFEYGRPGRAIPDRGQERPCWPATTAHLTLATVVSVAGVAAIWAMGVPLLVFARQGLRVSRLPSLTVFFASLGAGLAFLATGVLQRANGILGHPPHSLAVTLAGLLCLAGIGMAAACAGRVGLLAWIRKGTAGTAGLSILWLVVWQVLIPTPLAWPAWVRFVLALVSILPVGLCMGIPFAFGLRRLHDTCPRFIPWAWGIYALAAVLGWTLAVAIAMRVGFAAVVLLGSAAYALALLVRMTAASGREVHPTA